MLELGAGTGKLTRLLASRFSRVIAVEPDDEMRRRLGFDTERALAEVARVLRPRGMLVLLWNVPTGPIEPPIDDADRLLEPHWPLEIDRQTGAVRGRGLTEHDRRGSRASVGREDVAVAAAATLGRVPGRAPRRITPRPRSRFFRWYSILFGTTRPAMWFSRKVLWRLDPFILRLTGGRFSLGPGTPTLLLETIGARTGQRREHAVIYFSDGDDVVIVASLFGAPHHPAWFHNARANPDVRVNGLPYRATVVADRAELDRLWPLADQVLPAYAVYRERAAAAGRTIPILRLRPTSRT